MAERTARLDPDNMTPELKEMVWILAQTAKDGFKRSGKTDGTTYKKLYVSFRTHVVSTPRRRQLAFRVRPVLGTTFRRTTGSKSSSCAAPPAVARTLRSPSHSFI